MSIILLNERQVCLHHHHHNNAHLHHHYDTHQHIYFIYCTFIVTLHNALNGYVYMHLGTVIMAINLKNRPALCNC